MKTTIKPSYLIIGASLMLSACAQEDTPIPTDDAARKIIFRTSIPGVTSRATEITKDFTYFRLTAFNPADNDSIDSNGLLRAYINNDSIDKTLGQDEITSDKCIWPAPGKDGNMSFFAYYPSLPASASFENGCKVIDGNATIGYKIKDYTIASDIASQVDFVTASTTGSMAENLFTGIRLNFGHQLSRIEVKAGGSNPSFDIEIAGVRIGGAGMQGTYDFTPAEGAGAWSEMVKGKSEYIYRPGDKVVKLSSTAGTQAAAAVSIMGSDLGTETNCAMLLPTTDTDGWDNVNDPANAEKRMYLSVLLRVTDAKGTQQYPYPDNNQGQDALYIQVIYLAVNSGGEVKDNPGQLYRGEGGEYYTDSAKQTRYAAPEGCTVKEFRWAAVPVKGKWNPGYIYTYTLDYSYGIGLHDPDEPNPGEPILSDNVIVNLTVSEWLYGADNGVEMPRR